jgi:hypothetical protein
MTTMMVMIDVYTDKYKRYYVDGGELHNSLENEECRPPAGINK